MKILSLSLRVLVLAFLASTSHAVAQTLGGPFLETLSNTATLSSDQTSRYNKIKQGSRYEANWLVKVNAIQNYLSGNTLTVQLPGASSPTTFTADHVSSTPQGTYYWSGYNANGSNITVGKTTQGYYGSAYLAPANQTYEIVGLGTDKAVYLRYTSKALGDGCATGENPNEDIEETVSDRSGCESNLVRILFLVSPAASTSGFNAEAGAAATIATLNMACTASGISPTQLSFQSVGVLPLAFSESNDPVFDVNLLRNNATAQDLRNVHRADIVMLLVAPSSYFNALTGVITLGISFQSAVNADAYSIVDIGAPVLTSVHEVGHIMGARHQRCTDCPVNQCTNATVNHGFPVGTASATIMRQLTCADTGARTRIPRFSSPSAPFMGMATGDGSNNNAAILRARAPKVSCFRPKPSVPTQLTNVDIDGPTTITCTATGGFGYYTASLNTFDGVPPYTYLWEVSANGMSGWTTVGSQSYLPLSTAGLPNPFFLRVTITDYANKTGTDVMSVSLINCLQGEDSDRESITITNTTRVFPNPIDDILVIQPALGDFRAVLFNADGKQIRTLFIDPAEKMVTMQTSDLPAGHYFLQVTGNHHTSTCKIVKL